MYVYSVVRDYSIRKSIVYLLRYIYKQRDRQSQASEP
jgi:hypothetical protein